MQDLRQADCCCQKLYVFAGVDTSIRLMPWEKNGLGRKKTRKTKKEKKKKDRKGEERRKEKHEKKEEE